MICHRRSCCRPSSSGSWPSVDCMSKYDQSEEACSCFDQVKALLTHPHNCPTNPPVTEQNVCRPDDVGDLFEHSICPITTRTSGRSRVSKCERHCSKRHIWYDVDQPSSAITTTRIQSPSCLLNGTRLANAVEKFSYHVVADDQQTMIIVSKAAAGRCCKRRPPPVRQGPLHNYTITTVAFPFLTTPSCVQQGGTHAADPGLISKVMIRRRSVSFFSHRDGLVQANQRTSTNFIRIFKLIAGQGFGPKPGVKVSSRSVRRSTKLPVDVLPRVKLKSNTFISK